MITHYEYAGSSIEPWKFDPIKLDKINLLVGTSGSGKTRFLNTLFNFANFVSKGKPFRSGKWNLKVSVDEWDYDWEYEGMLEPSGKPIIINESLSRVQSNNKEVIIKRNESEFFFYDQKLPKLESDILSVTLLKEEDSIKFLYKLFSHMLRRKFHEDALAKACAFESISQETIKRFKGNTNLDQIWGEDHPIQARMYLFKEFFSEKYCQVTDFFKQTFSTVEEIEIKFLTDSAVSTEGIVPILMVKEKGVKDLIPLTELSSGMQKVLLIITDIISLPKNSTYIIDEYENSLGINAINFLPEFLLNHGGDSQYFITTHHPYLISNMPINTWLVFFRKGSNVLIKSGRELEDKFGKSKQKSFIQLLNDPFYLEGKK